jgi:hypothetical protein
MRRHAVFSLAASILAIAPAAAQQPEGQGPTFHVVRQGETLWELAARYLANPYRWPELFAANRDVVRNPHWIYPQDRLVIPGIAGALADALGGFGPLDEQQRTVFYTGSRETASAHTVQLSTQIQTPTVVPGAFYGAWILVPDAELEPVGQIVEVVSPSAVPMRTSPQIQPYDRVLVRLTRPATVGDRLHLMRRGRAVNPYGRVFAATGSGVVLSIFQGTATVEVDRFYDLVGIGDIAVPMPGFEPRAGVTPRPAQGLEGLLLEFANPHPIVATEELGFVNLGTASGVVEGDEFEVYIAASATQWGVRPEERVGRLQVVRAERLTSTVRVVELAQPALASGLPVRLVARMP